VPIENDKATVLALREIAAGNITPEMLREPETRPESLVPDADNEATFRAPAVRSDRPRALRRKLRPEDPSRGGRGLCVFAVRVVARREAHHSGRQGAARQSLDLPAG